MPALGFALVAATESYPLWARILGALLAGATRETAPLLAAAFSWSPIPLVGLLAVPWWRQGKPWRNRHLFEGNLWRRFGQPRIRGGFTIGQLAPLGGAIPGLVSFDPRVWVALLIATLPTFRSVDYARLVAAASPIVILSAVQGASPEALLAMVGLGLLLSSVWEA